MMQKLAAFLGGVLLLGVIPELSAIQLFSCGFEDDLCGMTQRTDDHFDWTRHSGSTTPDETGPSSAYNGTFYIYTEASDAHYSSVAEIETGSLRYSGKACLTFAYHMYGFYAGELAVMSKPGGTTNWTVTRDRGDLWQMLTIEMDLSLADRVSFRGVTGAHSQADIALDDIFIRTGECRVTEPLPFRCSFEEGFCGMLQRYDDQLDWTRYDKPTNNSGPQNATDGTWFIYINTTYQNFRYSASIETPAIDFTGSIRVGFKYHENAFFLKLTVFVVNVETERLIFRMEGNQGSDWHTVEIDVPEIHRGDWLRFTGDGMGGALALDDILISQQSYNGCEDTIGGCNGICIATDGSHTCIPSCPAGYSLQGTTSCIECIEAYNQIAVADQGRESTCDTEESLSNITRDACLWEACQREVEVVAIRNEICDLKRCQDKNAQVEEGPLSSVGWDIFVLNLTLSEPPGEQPGNNQGSSDFSLWQVIVAVTVAVIAFAVIGVVVYLKRRKKASQGQEQAVPTAIPSDVTGPANEAATYEEDGYLHPVTRTTSAIQMSPLRSDAAVPAPHQYLDLDLYEQPLNASYVTAPARVCYENDAALPTRPAGDVTEPADGVAYDDVRGPAPITTSAAQIQMSPPRSDPEDPGPGGYEHLRVVRAP